MVQTKQKVLCKLKEIDDLSSKSFSVKIGREKTEIFIVRKGDDVFAYINICPHTNAPLEWNPDEFLDENKEYIVCALHGAKFSIEGGDCLGGPCNGNGLDTLNVKIVDGQVVLFS